jgi:hypothetical protein
MEKPRTPEERSRFREQHIQNWRSSGLSQTEYCRQNNISSKTFLYWKRKHKAANEPVCLVEVPVSPLRPSCSSPIRLIVGTHYRIEIERDFDKELLDQLLRFMERR